MQKGHSTCSEMEEGLGGEARPSPTCVRVLSVSSAAGDQAFLCLKQCSAFWWG